MTKVRIFSTERLQRLLNLHREHTSFEMMADRAGIASNSLYRWSAGDEILCQAGTQDQLYTILGDELFTYGLDTEKFVSFLEEEVEARGSQAAVSRFFDIRPSTIQSWISRRNSPSMNMHEHIYRKCGLSVFKRMKHTDSWLVRLLYSLLQRIRG